VILVEAVEQLMDLPSESDHARDWKAVEGGRTNLRCSLVLLSVTAMVGLKMV
jgi:hypothetical protein